MEIIPITIPQEVVSLIKDIEWSNTYKRKIKQYGYDYDYRTKSCTECEKFPDCLRKFADSIDVTINQCIINKYEPGETISPHIDASCFGDIVYSISLHDGIIRMTKGSQVHDYVMEPNTMLILKDDYRWKWKHETRVLPHTRISITLRKLLQHKL